MSQNTQQDSRPIVEVVDLPEFSVEHSTEFLTGSAPCAGVSRPLTAVWFDQRAHALSNINKTEGEQMRRALTALGIIAALGLAAVLAAEVFPALRTLAAWQAGCY